MLIIPKSYYLSFTVSEVSIVIIYVFLRLNSIMTAVSACNAFTYSTGRDANNPILLAAASQVTTISMTIAASELQ